MLKGQLEANGREAASNLIPTLDGRVQETIQQSVAILASTPPVVESRPEKRDSD